MLKLIRWYGKYMLRDNYNKSAFFQLIDILDKEKSVIDNQISNCDEIFPTLEFLKKMAMKSIKKKTLSTTDATLVKTEEMDGIHSSLGEIKDDMEGEEDDDKKINYGILIGSFSEKKDDKPKKKEDKNFSFSKAVEKKSQKTDKDSAVGNLMAQKSRA